MSDAEGKSHRPGENSEATGHCDSDNPCEALKHVDVLFESCRPDEIAGHENRDDYYNDGKFFLSRERVKTYFTEPSRVKQMLLCKCNNCSKQRDELKAGGMNPVDKCFREIVESDAWELLALLVTLNKLHVIHHWVFNKVKLGADGTPRATELFAGESNRSEFLRDCDKLVAMLKPVEFQPGTEGQIPEYEIHKDARRFPYVEDTNYKPTPGHFGTIQKFLIPDEYVHDSIKNNLTQNYPGNATKYHFCRKVIKIKLQPNPMEATLLRVISTIKEDVKHNIIALVAVYGWESQLHFVFPFVDGDLYKVLKGIWHPKEISRSSQPLPSHWLWKQIRDVCGALSFLHTKLTDPLPDGRPVRAFHFDLKPANLLVTDDGRMKITDFGQSHIKILEDRTDETGPFRGGDWAYRAPEAKPESDVMSAYITTGSSTESSDSSNFHLNYDVWSLACIMTEIVAFILLPIHYEGAIANHAVDQLAVARSTEDPPSAFYNKELQLKRVIKEQLEKFRSHDDKADGPLRVYHERIVDILLGMFKETPEQRLASDQVLRRLDDAMKEFRTSRIRRRMIDTRSQFAQQSNDWPKHASLLELQDVVYKTEYISETPGVTWRTNVDQCKCLIQLYNVPSRKRYVLRVGYEMDQEIKLDEWPLKLHRTWHCPEYVSEPSGRVLNWKIGVSYFSKVVDRKITLGFARSADAHRFQAAIFGYTVLLEDRSIVTAVTAELRKRSRNKDAPPRTFDGPFVLQFWRSIKEPAGGSEADHVAIFGRDKSYLIIPINKRQTKFNKSHNRKNQISIVAIDKFFHVLVQDSNTQLPQQILTPAITVAAIQREHDAQKSTEPGYLLELATADISFSNQSGFGIFETHGVKFSQYGK